MPVLEQRDTVEILQAIEVKSNTSTEWSLKLSFSTLKFIAFIVVTNGQQNSAALKYEINGPPHSILICLRSNCSYQNRFLIYEPVSAVFVFKAKLIRQNGALSEKFSWMNWFCLEGMMKVLSRVSK